jgi:predicted aspartyl protease
MGMNGTLDPDMMNNFDIDFDFAGGTTYLFSQDHCPAQVVYWTQTGFIAIPMETAPSGPICVPVTINGKSVRAILDTGAVTSVMSMSTAESLGIKPDDPDLKLKRSYGLDGRYKEYTYPFKSLALDGLTVNNPHITIMSDNTIGRLDSDMILGIGFLHQLHLYIASWERKLYITPASAN